MNRNTAMIATGATALLCGCPGLFACFGGLMFAIVSQIRGADIDMMGSSDPQSALLFGVGGICFGLVLVLIPAAVGFFTLRNKPA